MRDKKSIFSMSFYIKGQLRLFLEYVNDTDKAIRWVENKGIEWDTCNIYHRKTREKLQVLQRFEEVSEYSLTFINKNGNNIERVLHLANVSDVQNAINWAFSRGFTFTYVNVYNRLTKDFIKRIYT